MAELSMSYLSSIWVSNLRESEHNMNSIQLIYARRNIHTYFEPLTQVYIDPY